MVTIPQAIKTLQDALSEDKEQGSYYHSWQCNIAMSFYDECVRFSKANKKKSISDTTFMEVADRAAKNFLELLISQQTKDTSLDVHGSFN